MPSFAYFLLLLGIGIAFLVALRVTLLRLGRRLQARIGFSDTALTDLVITAPLFGFLIVFVAGMVWLWRLSSRSAVHSRSRRPFSPRPRAHPAVNLLTRRTHDPAWLPPSSRA
jgi:hypothetical protein